MVLERSLLPVLEQVPITQKADEDQVNFGQTEGSDEENLVSLYLHQIHQYPSRMDYIEKTLFGYLRSGKTIPDLRKSQNFLEEINPEDRPKFQNALRDSNTIKDLIINCNLSLVPTFAKRYRGRGLSFLDLIQEGNLGLIRAIEKFDSEKDNKFSTYAVWWIRQSIVRALGDKSKVIRLPVYMYINVGKAWILEEEFRVINGRLPTEEELSRLLLTRIHIPEA